MRIVTRAEWGAREPEHVSTTPWTNRRFFAVHYSAGPPDQSVRTIQNFHMDTRGWSDIGYNWLVDRTGLIYYGRGWHVIGAHIENHNTECIGTCFIGSEGDFTPAAAAAIRWLYDQSTAIGNRELTRRVHRDFAATTCPGDTIAEWVHGGMPPIGNGGTPVSVEPGDVNAIWDEPIKVSGTLTTPDGKAYPENIQPARDRLALAHRYALAGMHVTEQVWRDLNEEPHGLPALAGKLDAISDSLPTTAPVVAADIVQALIEHPTALAVLAERIASEMGDDVIASAIADEVIAKLGARLSRALP